jgi:hypothetical protein
MQKSIMMVVIPTNQEKELGRIVDQQQRTP